MQEGKKLTFNIKLLFALADSEKKKKPTKKPLNQQPDCTHLRDFIHFKVIG